MRWIHQIVLGLSLVVASGAGCGDPVTPPKEERNPGNYTWTRDTLGDGTYQSSPNDIWGTSENDVYMVGHSSDFGSRKMWHFDGQRWNDITSVYFQTFPGPPWYPYYPHDITGFGTNDVWIVGMFDTTDQYPPPRAGFALHKKSGGWEGIRIPGAMSLYSVGGVSSTDLWVGGINRQMFHYDGQIWQEYFLPDSTPILFIRAITSDRVYASGWEFPAGRLVVKYFEWNGLQWTRIEELQGFENEPRAGVTFEIIDGQIVSADGSHILKRVSSGVWTPLYADPSVNFWYTASSGSRSFGLGKLVDDHEAAVYLDKGNWRRITALNAPNSVIFRGWSSSEATFLVGEELTANGTIFPRTYVIRGK